MSTSLHDTTATGPAKTLREQMREVIDYDDARASAPQEHAMTLLAAMGFALCALRTPTRTAAVCHAMLSGALLYRAASGRDGVRQWAGASSARPSAAPTQNAGAKTTDWHTSGPQATSADTGA